MARARRYSHLAAGICLIVATIITAPVAQAAEAETIHVDTTESTSVNNGNCDLLEALEAAELDYPVDGCEAGGAAAPDRIAFNIGGGGAATITPTSYISVDSPVYIDGSTQPGYAGVPLIRISRNTTTVLRLYDAAAGSTVEALQIDTATGIGNVVEVFGDDVTLIGNYFSTDGASVVGTGFEAVTLSEASNVQIGGPTASERNLFGGERGVSINGGSNNTVEGNYFGVTATGSALLAGTPAYPMHGVNMGHNLETSGNTVRNNVISGAYDRGVYIESYAHDNVVAGNIIGLGADGTTRIGNAWGVAIHGADSNTIGGTTAADRNVISGNDLYNILVYDLTGAVPSVALANQISGNYIGTTADGMSRVTAEGAEGGDETGIWVQEGENTTIGGPTAAHGNVIAGNDYGIEVGDDVSGTTILNNKIGTNAAGTAALRQEVGISLHSGTDANVGDETTPGHNLVSGAETGIRIGAGAVVSLYDNRIGLTALGNAALPNDLGVSILGDADVTLVRNWIAHNVEWGLVVSDTATINVLSMDNCITDHPSYGARALVPGTPSLTGNWWGSPTGPTHWANPGGTGDAIWGDPVYAPFLTEPPAACPRAPSDFDGDGRTDPAKFVPGTSTAWWFRSSDGNWDGMGMGADVASYVARSDFDGDGKTDPAKYVSGQQSLWYRESSSSMWEGVYMGAGSYSLLPGSDFDGDGMTDPAKYDTLGSVWRLLSGTGTWAGTFIGTDAAPAIPGSDYDGDGKTDVAKYVAAGAIWYQKSSDSTWDGAYIGPDGTPVPASDFDGDGITDMAKYLTGSNTLWYVASSTSSWQGAYLGPGTFTYVPAADFDGDGRTDPAKFDTGSQVLWYLKSSTGTWDGVYMGGGTYQIVN